MKHLVAFAGSNSSTSINKQLVTYTTTLIKDVETTILDLNEFNMPIYNSDIEAKQGIPEKAHTFIDYIKNCDGIVVALAEHNGAYTVAFKNILDWISRIESKSFYNKPMLLMAASPGGRGGLSVLEMAKNRFPRHNATIVDTFSLPNFYDNFKEGQLLNEELHVHLETAVNAFIKAIHHE